MLPVRSLPSSSTRWIGRVAALTPVWFGAVYAAMAALRPEFSHLTDAVSELGSVGAPRAWVWNVFGYGLPGVAVALLGAGLGRAFADDRRVRLPAYALMVAGAFIVLSGMFPGDFEDRDAFTMQMHTVGSLLSFPAFLVAGFTLPRVLRARASARWAVWPSLVLVVASVLTGVLRSGAMPGLGQRLGFACVFLWVGLMGLVVLRADRS